MVGGIGIPTGEYDNVSEPLHGEKEKEKMKLPSVNATELSTAHIEESDSSLLSRLAKETECWCRLFMDPESSHSRFQMPYPPLAVYNTGFGFIVVIPSKELWQEEEMPQKVVDMGASQTLINILNLCVEQELSFLELDPDAAEVEGLPKFDW
jgi:hypothetical protein